MGKPSKVKTVSVKLKNAKKPVESSSSEEDTDAHTGGGGFFQFDFRMKEVRGAFLRGVALVYFVAFLSTYLQIDGLYGANGVTPIKAELKLASRKPSQCLKDKYSLLCWAPGFFEIDSHRAMELLAILGTLISALGAMCVHCCVVPVFAILWALYFSMYQVGGVFLWFQWDILLLETGVLAILAAPWLPTKGALASKPRDLLTLWMVKWLLFRLMFASGVVKLQSGCPTWWGLTALNYHFESQCIPTPLAYYAHHLPAWLLQLMTVGTYYVEILVPFAFFAPFKILHRFSFYIQMLFQLAVIATGNYTFFNLLTMVLCICLLDADFFVKKSASSNQPQEVSLTRVTSRSFSFTLIGLSIYYTVKYFGLYVKPDYTIGSKIAFLRKDFDWFVSVAVPYSVMLAFLTLASTLAQTLVISLFDIKGAWKKLTSLLSCIFYGALCIGLFGLTLVPYTSLHKETNRALWQSVRDAHVELSRYHLTSSYGLFRRMTGTEKGRPEVVLEYADEISGPWKEYQFMYKTGNVSAAPAFVAPHQPRLDWQMWFAALGTYHDNPWLVSLTYRLLQGEQSVEKLLDPTKLPLKTPKYIRASLYHYTFTKPKGTAVASGGDWWTRKREKEFMPIFSKDHQPLIDFVKNLGYLEPDAPKIPNDNIYLILDKIRNLMQISRPENVVWSCLLAIVAIIFTSKLA